MVEPNVVIYNIKNQFEINLSYMPFIHDGGIFVPTDKEYRLGDRVFLDLTLPGHSEVQHVECRVAWITPKNCIHHAEQGIGLQFMGDNAKALKELIEANLDSSFDVGGYTYGLSSEHASKK